MLTNQNGIYVPNVFSPNNDGNNDYFQVFGNLGPIVYFDVIVFDRWGEKVFESQDPQFKWDGKYKGEPAPQGYLFTLFQQLLRMAVIKILRGSLTLLR